MANSRTFDEYNPAVEWSRSAEADAVRISLPGFKREDIRVLVDNHGHLRTHGERHVAGNRWSRFQTDVDLPANCNADGIRAKFENDRLTITLPKNTPSAPIPPAPRRPHMAAPSQRLPPAVAEPAARPAAPRPPVPAAPLPPAPAPAPSVKPPAEPRPSMPRKQSAFVPALAPAPAPLAPVPSVKPPVEPRPSMPKNPYAPVPAPAPAPQVEQPATTTKPAQSSLGAVHRPEEQEDRQRKREEEGKMAEDKKETVHEKKDTEQQRQQEKAMLAEKEMAFANQPRPAFASQGLLVNVAIAVVVLLGVTVHLWLSLRNATGGAGEHGHGPRAPGGR